MRKTACRTVLLMIMASLLAIPALTAMAADDWCLPEHTITPAEVRAFTLAAREVDTLAAFYGQAPAAEPDYADLGWQFLTAPEFGGLAGLGVTLPTLLEVPGFDRMDGLLTHFGGLLALAQFWVDLEQQDPMAQMKLAKSGSFWAVGALPEHLVSRAIKISAIGIGLIDYSLTTLGSTAIAGKTEYWYRVYKRYYDDRYGHRLADMAKWEKLIFDTYNGDFEKALTDGLMTFWNDDWRYSYEATSHAHAEPTPEEKEQIRQSYLAEILPTLKNYFRVKQDKAREKTRLEMQYAYNSIKRYLDTPLRFQGIVRTTAGEPLPDVAVSVPGAAPVTTDNKGIYRLQVKTCRLLAALSESGVEKTVLTAVYHPDPPLPEKKSVSRTAALHRLNRQLPNRVDLAFDIAKTRLVIDRQPLDEGRQWQLRAAVTTPAAEKVTTGKIMLHTAGGMFIGGA